MRSGTSKSLRQNFFSAKSERKSRDSSLKKILIAVSILAKFKNTASGPNAVSSRLSSFITIIIFYSHNYLRSNHQNYISADCTQAVHRYYIERYNRRHTPVFQSFYSRQAGLLLSIWVSSHMLLSHRRQTR